MADKINQVSKGNVVVYNGDLWLVTQIEHVKPGKGPAYYQIKMRNLLKGGVVSNRFNSNTEIEIAFIDTRKLEYLYDDGTGYVFMDVENYEQFTVAREILGDDAQWLRPNQAVSAKFYKGNPILVELPSTVVLKVEQCDAAARGDTVRNVTKTATLETGAKIKVPAFIEEGEWVKVDTRTGECAGRASANEIPEA